MPIIEAFIPITIFIAIATVLIIYFRLSFAYKHRVQDTIKLAIENGQPLSEDLVASLIVKPDPFQDMKKGIILLFFGMGISCFGWLIPDNDAVAFVAIGVIPAMVGIGYTVIWKMRNKFS